MEETQRYGKMEWIFYIVILPLLFTALLSGIILEFLGFDITGKIANAARQIPVVSSMFPEEPGQEGAGEGQKAADPAEQLQAVQDKADTLEKSKTQLESDLVKKNAEIEKLKKQIAASRDRDKEKSATGAGSGSSSGSATPAEEEPVDPVQQQANVVSQMSASKAAALMSQMSVTEAKRIFAKMTPEQQAAILEKMEPAVASKMLAS